MLRAYVEPGQPLLDHRFPLPIDRPFTYQQAAATGLQTRELGRLCEEHYLRRMVAGVYVATQVSDSISVRAAALRLVVPPDAVITDRTAGWLFGANMILAPGAHLVVPPVSVFLNRRGGRLRNGLVDSGQRYMADDDVMEVHGLAVTTPIRTACDLGRLLHRDRAFAALDSMLRLGEFSREDLVEYAERYRGMRGVRQLRAFAPMADGRAQSPGESVLRLRWLDLLTLPRPDLQIPVERPGEWPYCLDVGVACLRWAVEYDGEEWHLRTREQRVHDRQRRDWMRTEEGWLIDAVTKENLWGPKRDIESILVNGHKDARARL